MKQSLILIFVLNLTFFSSCKQAKVGKVDSNVDINKSIIDSLKKIESEIWQLDFYPDSILKNREIYKNSDWISSYAYNIEFTNDSCQFIGWWESWWNHIERINDNEFRTIDGKGQYWELKFETPEKLIVRQINYRKKTDQLEIGQFYSYHRVDTILTLDSLDHKIAKDIFSGSYHLVYSDTLDCEGTITLNENFSINGIKNLTRYSFETSIDCDYPVPNVFRLYSDDENEIFEFTFKFSADTLFIKEFERINDSLGDFDHFEIKNSRIKLVKLK